MQGGLETETATATRETTKPMDEVCNPNSNTDP